MKNQLYLNLHSALKWSVCILVLVITMTLSSCGSVISQSTVKLSADVGSRITEMEQLHQLAIQRYFDMERQKIEEFLTKSWEPLFLKNFLGTSKILQELQNVSRIDAAIKNQLENAFAAYLTDVSEAETATNDLIEKLNLSRKTEKNIVQSIVSDYVEDAKADAAVIHITSLLGTEEPAQIIFEFAEAAHNQMSEKRRLVLAPLRQLQAETSAALSASYADLIRGQSIITGRLEAAAKVSQEQDKLLETLGINVTTKDIQSKLSNFTTKIDNALRIANELTSEKDILSTLQTELQKIQNP